MTERGVVLASRAALSENRVCGRGGAGPGCVEDVFCQTFTAGLPGLGQPTEVDLVPGGAATMVTEDNRRAFVDAYVDCLLTRAVDRQFEVRRRNAAQAPAAQPAAFKDAATEAQRVTGACGRRG